jgi:recombination protein RecA
MRRVITPEEPKIETEDFDVDAAMEAVPHDPRQERWSELAEVAEEFSLWKPAPEVLTQVRSVRTIFPMFDRATRVFGYPIDRVNTVHGPSNHGKTAFSLGLGLSFLRQGHIFAHIDAEMTTPATWISKLFGQEVNNPGFLAMRPRNYEQAIDGVKQLTDKLADARAQGRVAEDTTALIVVDSIRKLAPKALLAKIAKEGADGLGGRAAQLKAAMNQAWLDDLTPQLYHTGASVLLIARESERPNATDDERKYDTAWQVQGGRGIIYDASLVMRITRSAWVYGPKRGDKAGPVLGEKIKVSIWKTKVEGKDDKHAIGFFHLSNGALVPEGFDRARDVLELAISYGIIEQKGSWFAYNGRNVAQGKDAVVKVLHANHKLLNHIENACRDEFKPDELVPMGHDTEEDVDESDSHR